MSSQPAGRDEPRCYFPKSLSGNPLRQLRSSRFTCAAGPGGRGQQDLVRDACLALPLKTPAQLHLTAVADAGQSLVFLEILRMSVGFLTSTVSVSAARRERGEAWRPRAPQDNDCCSDL